MDKIILLAAAVIPAVVLFIYVYNKDRCEKEPTGLLIGLLVLGAVCIVPAYLLERAATLVIDGAFRNTYYTTADSMIFRSTASFYGYLAVDNLLGVALIEEGLKWLVLLLVTRKNKNFDNFFDGLIYAVSVSLGFAAAENILYVIGGGFQTAAVRAFTAIPAHAFDAVLMGYFYSMHHLYDGATKLESDLMERGLIHEHSAKLKTKKYLILSLAIPVLIHGLYDFACSVGTTFWTIFFLVFLVALYFICFRKIRSMSKLDGENLAYSQGLVNREHPELAGTSWFL